MAVAVYQEFNRARVDIAHGAGRRHRRRAHLRSARRREVRRRRLLDNLLVPPLDGAVALEEVDRVAVAIGEHLDFDVARLDQELLQVDPRIPKRLARLATRALDGRGEVGRVHDRPHPLPAAATRCLDQHRVA